MKTMFQNSGEETCYFHNQVLIKWKVISEHPVTRIVFDCPALSEDKRCQVDSAPCPTEKVTLYIGLRRLRKAADYLF